MCKGYLIFHSVTCIIAYSLTSHYTQAQILLHITPLPKNLSTENFHHLTIQSAHAMPQWAQLFHPAKPFLIAGYAEIFYSPGEPLLIYQDSAQLPPPL
jgi:hypothetical protein